MEGGPEARVIICLCRGVQDRAVGAVIADGASTLDEIVDACGAGSDCGACHASLLELLAEARLSPVTKRNELILTK